MSPYAPPQIPLMNGEGSRPLRDRGVPWRRLFRLRGRMMLVLFLFGVALSVLAALFGAAPEYYARASMELSLPDYSTPRTHSYAALLADLRSPALLRQVLADAEVAKLPGVAGSPQLIDDIRARISVRAPRGDSLLEIYYRDRDRATAECILRKILAAYLGQLDAQPPTAAPAEGTAPLASREQTLASESQAVETKIAVLREEGGVPPEASMVSEPAAVEAQHAGLAEAERNLSEALSRQRAAENRVKRLEKLLASAEAAPAKPLHALGVETQVAQDPNVLELSRQLAAAEQALALASGKYVDGAPQLSVARSERDAVAGKMAQVKAETRHNIIEAMLEQERSAATLAQEEVAETKNRRTEYAAALDQHREEQLAMAKRAGEMKELERKLTELAADRRMMSTPQLASQASGAVPVQARMAEEVRTPDRPDYGPPLTVFGAGLLLSLALALLTGLIFEYADPRIWSVQDLGRITPIPVFSTLPDTREDRLPSSVSLPTLAESHPGSATVDQVRRAMARILSSGPGKTPIQTCLITSPGPGEGKTSFACNLAIVLAQAGRNVLLVDLNGTRPGVESAFGLQPAPGLSELLKNGEVAPDPDRNSGVENLFVLGPGTDCATLPEHMGAWVMQDFFAGAKRIFNHIILDCPSVLVSSEARIVAPLADGVVLVVRSGRASFGAVEQCLNVLHSVGGSVTGIVLNGVQLATEESLKQEISLFYREA